MPFPYTPSSRAAEPSPAPKIARASCVASLCRDLQTADVEHFILFSLDVRHRVIRKHVIAIGSLAGVEVHPRTVMRRLLEDNAAAAIFVHNHPSGDPAPSRADIELTKRLRECCGLFGIACLDHVVLGGGGWISLAERGWE